MNKPGTELEKAVFAFAKTLDPSAEVIFNHKVPDRDTGTLRQCDVWINARFGGHWPISILVSCKDHGRPLNIGDIGTFCDEIRSTSANTGVIYSKHGFYGPAIEKAKVNAVACCRLYENEPADMPHSIVIEHFACSPEYSITLHSDLRGTKFNNWKDLFDMPEDDKTIIDIIASQTAEAEEKSVPLESSTSTFPPDWELELRFREDETRPEIGLRMLCNWKWYRARVEATLLNGSYCLSDNSFRGTMTGPSIDLRGSHPGESWIEITDRNFPLPANRIIAILYRGRENIETGLRESLGLKALPSIGENE